MADINFALDKQKFGTEWTSRKKALEQLRNTAYHEAGHAIVAYFTESAMPLYKVSLKFARN